MLAVDVVVGGCEKEDMWSAVLFGRH